MDTFHLEAMLFQLRHLTFHQRDQRARRSGFSRTKAGYSFNKRAHSVNSVTFKSDMSQ